MNIIEGIQAKCNYIRETIIPEYGKLGPVGAFGKAALLTDIKAGEAAIASGDVILMIQVYKSLEETCRTAL